MQKLWQEHKDRVAIDGDARIGREFAPGKAQSKTFYQTHRQDFSRFLSGCLSSAFAPGIGDARYDGFVNRLKDIFDRHSVDGALPCTYRLLCLIGDPSDLAY